MKKEFLTRTATALLIAIIALAGCKKDPDPVEPGEPANTITMTTAKSGWTIIGMSGTGKAVIDWGDGSVPDTVTLSADGNGYPHTFSDTILRKIYIDGQNITHLYCDNMELIALDVTNNNALTCLYCSDNQLTVLDVAKNIELIHLYCGANHIMSLDVKNNTALTSLNCSDNQLTALDMTKNIALEWLECNNNQLTAEGLNALFGTLPANEISRGIRVVGNPGASGCDRSIATAKGWIVF